MADKKIDCLTWHCSDTDKRTFLGLADMNGMSGSEEVQKMTAILCVWIVGVFAIGLIIARAIAVVK